MEGEGGGKNVTRRGHGGGIDLTRDLAGPLTFRHFRQALIIHTITNASCCLKHSSDGIIIYHTKNASGNMISYITTLLLPATPGYQKLLKKLRRDCNL